MDEVRTPNHVNPNTIQVDLERPLQRGCKRKVIRKLDRPPPGPTQFSE